MIGIRFINIFGIKKLEVILLAKKSGNDSLYTNVNEAYS